MDIAALGEFINTVGFPCFVVCLIAWQNHKSEERHAQSESAWRETVNNNTEALHGVKEELARRVRENESK